MKYVLGFSALLLSANAMATIPSLLPDGEYLKKCSGFSVEKLDPIPAGSNRSWPSHADANGIVRMGFTDSGTTKFVTVGNSTTITDDHHNAANDGSFSDDALEVYQVSLRDLSNGKFESVESGTGSYITVTKDDPTPSKSNINFSFRRTFEVRGSYEINLTTADKNDPEVAAHSESLTFKNADGSFTLSEYLREANHIDRKDLGNGAYSLAKTQLQYTTTCNYTRIH